MRIFKIALLVVFAASTVLGTADSVTAAVPCTPKGTFQDDHPNGASPHVDFTYTDPGDWVHLSNYVWPDGGSPRNETISYTKESFFPSLGENAAVTFTLNCVSGFRYYYTTASNRGIVQIYGNNLLREIDLYSPGDPKWRQSTYISLPPGVNTIRIVPTGRKNPASSDYYIDFDGITPL